MRQMPKTRLIELDRPGRLLKKACDYLANVDLFMADSVGALDILLDALPHADTTLQLKMLTLLGYVGEDRVLWPLYNLVMDPSANDQIRRSAAIQLGLAASLSDDPEALKTELIEQLNRHPEASVRSNCALALGWRGNRSAVTELLHHLQDPDRDVQTAVVTALSSMGDARIFDRLVALLDDSDLEGQRCILLNLWRFNEQRSRVEAIYLGWLKRPATDLHADVLSALGMMRLSPEIINLYRRLLADRYATIRCQVVQNLSSADPNEYACISDSLNGLLKDEDARVRQAAIRLLSRR
jgi:HEAT repeat protein